MNWLIVKLEEFHTAEGKFHLIYSRVFNSEPLHLQCLLNTGTGIYQSINFCLIRMSNSVFPYCKGRTLVLIQRKN